LCAHVLASRGELDLDAPVAEYWPEFARKGKEHATVKMMLDHSVGLPAFRTPLRPGGCTDWDYMCGMLADEEPFWKPGTRNGYHMINFGWTVGELVRRASGRSLGTFFREELATPLGVDFWIGAPEEIEPRIAPMMMYAPKPGDAIGEFMMKVMTEPQSIQALSLLNSGGFDPNSRACHAAEIGGAGGISNARGLSGIYAPFASGGELAGRRYVDAKQLARMGEVSAATHEDATLLIPSRFALGFMKSTDNRRRARRSRHRDPVVGRVNTWAPAAPASLILRPASFGYSMNQMSGNPANERGQSLVDATYRALGFRSNEGGVWAR
jgi:CubicO group peptidase (beta-lactamase class C family)